MSDIGLAPEPSKGAVAAAFGDDTAAAFEQIRKNQQAITPSSVTFTPPDPEMIKIVRLYLEKYEVLAEEDKKLYRRVVAMIVNPPIVFTEPKR